MTRQKLDPYLSLDRVLWKAVHDPSFSLNIYNQIHIESRAVYDMPGDGFLISIRHEEMPNTVMRVYALFYNDSYCIGSYTGNEMSTTDRTYFNRNTPAIRLTYLVHKLIRQSVIHFKQLLIVSDIHSE